MSPGNITDGKAGIDICRDVSLRIVGLVSTAHRHEYHGTSQYSDLPLQQRQRPELVTDKEIRMANFSARR